MGKHIDYEVKRIDEESTKPKTLEDVLEAVGENQQQFVLFLNRVSKPVEIFQGKI